MVRILHLSDLHFREKHAWDADPLLRKLVDDTAASAPFDLLIVTGDLAHSGKRAEYALAHAFLNALVTRIELDRARVVLVPGNHDVDRDRIDVVGAALADRLRAADEQTVHDVLSDDSQRSALLRRSGAWQCFAKEWGGGDVPWQSRPFPELGVHVAVLSSALLSAGDRDRGTLRISRPQWALATQGRAPEHRLIAAMHHPLDYLTEADQAAMRTALRQAHVVLRGHLHDPDLVRELSPAGATYTFAAGAAYQGSQYPNSYSVVELHDDGSARTQVRIWHTALDRWVPDRNAFPPDGWWPPDAPPAPSAAPSADRLEGLLRRAFGSVDEAAEVLPPRLRGAASGADWAASLVRAANHQGLRFLLIDLIAKRAPALVPELNVLRFDEGEPRDRLLVIGRAEEPVRPLSADEQALGLSPHALERRAQHARCAPAELLGKGSLSEVDWAALRAPSAVLWLRRDAAIESARVPWRRVRRPPFDPADPVLPHDLLLVGRDAAGAPVDTLPVPLPRADGYAGVLIHVSVPDLPVAIELLDEVHAPRSARVWLNSAESPLVAAVAREHNLARPELRGGVAAWLDAQAPARRPSVSLSEDPLAGKISLAFERGDHAEGLHLSANLAADPARDPSDQEFGRVLLVLYGGRPPEEVDLGRLGPHRSWQFAYNLALRGDVDAAQRALDASAGDPALVRWLIADAQGDTPPLIPGLKAGARRAAALRALGQSDVQRAAYLIHGLEANEATGPVLLDLLAVHAWSNPIRPTTRIDPAHLDAVVAQVQRIADGSGPDQAHAAALLVSEDGVPEPPAWQQDAWAEIQGGISLGRLLALVADHPNVAAYEMFAVEALMDLRDPRAPDHLRALRALLPSRAVLTGVLAAWVKLGAVDEIDALIGLPVLAGTPIQSLARAHQASGHARTGHVREALRRVRERPRLLDAATLDLLWSLREAAAPAELGDVLRPSASPTARGLYLLLRQQHPELPEPPDDGVAPDNLRTIELEEALWWDQAFFRGYAGWHSLSLPLGVFEAAARVFASGHTWGAVVPYTKQEVGDAVFLSLADLVLLVDVGLKARLVERVRRGLRIWVADDDDHALSSASVSDTAPKLGRRSARELRDLVAAIRVEAQQQQHDAWTILPIAGAPEVAPREPKAEEACRELVRAEWLAHLVPAEVVWPTSDPLIGFAAAIDSPWGVFAGTREEAEARAQRGRTNLRCVCALGAFVDSIVPTEERLDVLQALFERGLVSAVTPDVVASWNLSTVEVRDSGLKRFETHALQPAGVGKGIGWQVVGSMYAAALVDAQERGLNAAVLLDRALALQTRHGRPVLDFLLYHVLVGWMTRHPEATQLPGTLTGWLAMHRDDAIRSWGRASGKFIHEAYRIKADPRVVAHVWSNFVPGPEHDSPFIDPVRSILLLGERATPRWTASDLWTQLDRPLVFHDEGLVVAAGDFAVPLELAVLLHRERRVALAEALARNAVTVDASLVDAALAVAQDPNNDVILSAFAETAAFSPWRTLMDDPSWVASFPTARLVRGGDLVPTEARLRAAIDGPPADPLRPLAVPFCPGNDPPRDALRDLLEILRANPEIQPLGVLLRAIEALAAVPAAVRVWPDEHGVIDLDRDLPDALAQTLGATLESPSPDAAEWVRVEASVLGVWSDVATGSDRTAFVWRAYEWWSRCYAWALEEDRANARKRLVAAERPDEPWEELVLPTGSGRAAWADVRTALILHTLAVGAGGRAAARGGLSGWNERLVTLASAPAVGWPATALPSREPAPRSLAEAALRLLLVAAPDAWATELTPDARAGWVRLGLAPMERRAVLALLAKRRWTPSPPELEDLRGVWPDWCVEAESVPAALHLEAITNEGSWWAAAAPTRRALAPQRRATAWALRFLGRVERGSAGWPDELPVAVAEVGAPGVLLAQLDVLSVVPAAAATLRTWFSEHCPEVLTDPDPGVRRARARLGMESAA